MKTIQTLKEIPPRWTLSLALGEGEDGMLLQAVSEKGPVLTLEREGTEVAVSIHTVWQTQTQAFGDCPSFVYTLKASRRSGSFQICLTGPSIRFLADDELEDEEWPLGEAPAGPWEIRGTGAVRQVVLTEGVEAAEDREISFSGPFHHYSHPGTNTGVGDCMPFERDGRWCLYYLLDRRGHRSKNGLGAHQWAQVSTSDFRHWKLHPMALSITEQWEGSICTGSLLKAGNRTYAFYAVRMSDGSAARLSWAESEDGVHFRKSGEYFTLSDPYEPVSARDPKVFADTDGCYHMLVTTSLAGAGRYGGCLAHLTSTDLHAWVQQPPFIVPGYSDQPECSDYFEWNGFYYLVFSNFAIARYRFSRSPFGPWERPENDLLDALEVQVPKTAAFGNRRFSSGFLARRPRAYAGSAVTHELFQRPDGTLGVMHAEDMLPEAVRVREAGSVVLEGGGGRAGTDLPEVRGDFRLQFTWKTGTEPAVFGLNLKLAGETGDGKHSYRIEFDPAAETVVIVRPGEDFHLGAGRDLLKHVRLTPETAVDLIVCGDILDLGLSGGRMMVMRLDERIQSGTQAELYVQAGSAEAKAIRLTDYC